MPSRKGGPVLFELVRGGSHPARSVSTGGAGAQADAEPAGGGWWNWAGRSIRVPAGYIFVVAAVVVAAGLLGYVIGFGRAERLAEAEAARRVQQSVPVSDPLSEAPLNLDLTAPTLEEPVEDEASAGTDSGPPAEPAGATQSGSGGASGGDPRTAGLNYYVIVRDLPAEGARLVEWLEARGVASMTENVSGGLVKVIVLQGFPRGQASSARALAFKEHLRELGRRWKRDFRGSSDFSDLYLEKHDPE